MSVSISAAAALLRTTPRMLRYRERVGLLPPGATRGAHRRYGEGELRAAAAAIDLETRYDVSPGTLAFALRVLSEPRLGAEVAELGRLLGRPVRRSTGLAALDFDQRKALELLGARRGPLPATRGSG